MKKVVPLILTLLFISPLSFAGPSSSQFTQSTLDDQESVEVTVYNQNMGLVKDTRSISLPMGEEKELRFMDVAAYIMPVTVLIKSLNAPESLSILEQNYEYDLINPQKLMDKYVGKEIKILDRNMYKDTTDIVYATLLSNNQGEVYQIDDEIYLGHPGFKVLPEIPDNLISKPTLTWMYDNSASEPHRIQISYLTNSLNWKADYVLAVNEDDTFADLSGWVTVDNKSGATYQDAKLKLVAGEVQRAPQNKVMRMAAMDSLASGAMQERGFIESGFFEYHIYDLQRPTTIKDKQTKQISLLEAKGVKIQKERMITGYNYYYFSRYTNQDLKSPVEVYLKFENEEDNALGMPLPAGIIRVYKEDSAKSLQFIGENSIDHTPKDEEVKIKVGEAFDVVAERKQMDYQVLSKNVIETEWEITLRNHKQEDVNVVIKEPLSGDWHIVHNSHEYEKTDAFTIRFDVAIPKDEEVKVTYRVRVKNR